MKVLALFFTISLGVALAEVDTSDCRSVKADPTFNFDEFVNGQYKFEAGTGTSDLKNFQSAYLSQIQVDDLFYSIFSANLKDGTQQNIDYLITSQDGGIINEVVLEDGQLTEQEVIVTVYGYEANAYVQIYICGQKTAAGEDLRYVLSKGTVKLTPSQWKKISLADKNAHFTGSLTKILTGVKVADKGE